MPTKLVCFDLDGTLIDNTESIWQTVHEALGTDPVLRTKVMDDFFAGKISYREWAKHDVEIWKELGLTKSKILEIISGFEVMNGAHEILKELHEKGIKTAVISGSLKIVLDTFFPEHKFDDVFINELEYEGDRIMDVKVTDYDQAGKARALLKVCEREGIDTADTVFVGDQRNDIIVAKEAGIAIAFNSKSQGLNEVADFIIDEKDLRLILPRLHLN